MTKGNLFVFEVGPSVKFVSAIKDAVFNNKIGVNFLFGKNAKGGGDFWPPCGNSSTVQKLHILVQFVSKID